MFLRDPLIYLENSTKVEQCWIASFFGMDAEKLKPWTLQQIFITLLNSLVPRIIIRALNLLRNKRSIRKHIQIGEKHFYKRCSYVPSYWFNDQVRNWNYWKNARISTFNNYLGKYVCLFAPSLIVNIDIVFEERGVSLSFSHPLIIMNASQRAKRRDK